MIHNIFHYQNSHMFFWGNWLLYIYIQCDFFIFMIIWMLSILIYSIIFQIIVFETYAFTISLRFFHKPSYQMLYHVIDLLSRVVNDYETFMENNVEMLALNTKIYYLSKINHYLNFIIQFPLTKSPPLLLIYYPISIYYVYENYSL